MSNVTFKIKRRAIVSGAAPFDLTRITGGPNGQYVTDDVVIYNGNYYKALANNDAIIPSTLAPYWSLLGPASGAPASLDNGELAISEAYPTLFYGKQSSIAAVGGEEKFLSRDTSQSITGSKTFTSSVVLSSATAETKPTSASNTYVASTQFVKNVLAIIDGGEFGNPIEYIYFYGTTQENGQYLWSNIVNWYSDSTHTTQALALPVSSSYVRVLSTDNVLIDLDDQNYVNVESIQAYNSDLIIYSNASANFASSVYLNSTSTMTFSGNATNNL